MKVKDVDALREQIFHDSRLAYTKHEVWLLASEHNKTTPTFDAIPMLVLEDIKTELTEYVYKDKEYCFIDSDGEWLRLVDVCRIIDNHISGKE